MAQQSQDATRSEGLTGPFAYSQRGGCVSDSPILQFTLRKQESILFCKCEET